MAFTFAENIQVLVQAGYDVANITTPKYAARLASGVRKFQAKGYQKPSKEALRGHKSPPLHHIQRSKNVLEQYQMFAIETETGELTLQNLRTLLTKTPDPKGDRYILLVRGKVLVGSPLDMRSGSHEATYTYVVKKAVVKEWTGHLKKHAGQTLIDFFNFLPAGIVWAEIDMIGQVYAKGMI